MAVVISPRICYHPHQRIIDVDHPHPPKAPFRQNHFPHLHSRIEQLESFKRRVRLEIEERNTEEAEREALLVQKRADEKIARRALLLDVWKKTQVRQGLSREFERGRDSST